jgi:AcrR family transcriptional regulator
MAQQGCHENGNVLMMGPGRGRWDRAIDAERRREVQHRRLLDAAASAALRGDVTATRVVSGAGVGRNTFYRHFPNVDAAVAEALEEAVDDLRRALGRSVLGARTPMERVRAVASAWLRQALEQGAILGLLLHAGGPAAKKSADVLRELERHLRDALHLAKAAGIVGLPPDPLRLRCLVAGFVAAALHVTEHPSADLRAPVDVLVDLTLRSFR